MTDLIGRTSHQLEAQLPGRVSRPCEQGYAAATAIWAKPVGPLPRAIVHCRTAKDVQLTIRTAREAGVRISVRGGGHDWAGRALRGEIVIDLSGMNGVVVDFDTLTARISGGARASDVAAATDPLGLAAVTGSCGAVGMAGLTLGGGYGPLIGRFGLALDNLLAAEVVLADGRIVTASHDSQEELFWALRGGGGNFGIVTSMQYRLHELSGIRCGMLVFPFAEAKSVLERCADVMAAAPEELTAQFAIVAGADGVPMVIVVPAWCGLPAAGEAWLTALREVGAPLANTIDMVPCGAYLKIFDPFIVNGQRVLMETCWLPTLDAGGIDACVRAMASAVSPGCAIVTHQFKGAASRVPCDATAFGLRRDHVLIEIMAAYPDRSQQRDEQLHLQWVQAALRDLSTTAFPGAYPNLLRSGDPERASRSYGGNVARLISAKRRYDPDNVFSAIPLPEPDDRIAAA
jgi:FAD/FMN-containing dehydrogenase